MHLTVARESMVPKKKVDDYFFRVETMVSNLKPFSNDNHIWCVTGPQKKQGAV